MKMIEKVARAIANGKYDHPDTEPDDRRAYRQLAVDVLEAMKKPTPCMLEAGTDINPSTDATDPYGYAVAVHDTIYIYEAMIDAALNE